MHGPGGTYPPGDSVLALNVRRGQDQTYQVLTKHLSYSKLSKSIIVLIVLGYVRLQDFLRLIKLA